MPCFGAFAFAAGPIVLVRNADVPSAINAILLKAIYKKAGYELKVTPMPAARATVEAEGGAVDGEVNRVAAYATAHPNLIRVDPPISIWKISAFYKNSKQLSINGREDLKKYSLAHVRGLKGAEDLVEGATRVSLLATSEQLLKFLEQDRVEVIVDGQSQIKLYTERLGIKDLAQVELTRTPLYHYLHEKNRSLVPVISGIVKKLSDSGELARMYTLTENEFIASGNSP
jgi:ABC-type amino acid transport substrate-binding protein